MESCPILVHSIILISFPFIATYYIYHSFDRSYIILYHLILLSPWSLDVIASILAHFIPVYCLLFLTFSTFSSLILLHWFFHSPFPIFAVLHLHCTLLFLSLPTPSWTIHVKPNSTAAWNTCNISTHSAIQQHYRSRSEGKQLPTATHFFRMRLPETETSPNSSTIEKHVSYLPYHFLASVCTHVFVLCCDLWLTNMENDARLIFRSRGSRRKRVEWVNNS